MDHIEDGYWWIRHKNSCPSIEVANVCTSDDGARWVALFNDHRGYKLEEFSFIKLISDQGSDEVHAQYMQEIRHLEEIIEDQTDRLNAQRRLNVQLKRKAKGFNAQVYEGEPDE